jgi:hypothetical protein
MNKIITTDGDYPIQGIAPGREFSIACAGTFAGATIKAQYCTAPPAKATLTLEDAESNDAITLTATDGGTQGNEITIAVVTPDVPDAPLTLTQDERDFVISTATSAGDAATAEIGEGANGTVTITFATAGTVGNGWDVEVIQATAESVNLSAYVSGSNARPRLVVILGTDAEGDPDDAKNTATLVRAAIHALPQFTAVASGTGADPVAAQEVTPFEDGGENAVNISTVADVLALLQSSPLTAPHFNDEGELTGRNFGILPFINLNVASTTEDETEVQVIVNLLQR